MHILIEIFSHVPDRFGYRHHKCDPYVPARAITDLSFYRVAISHTAPGKGKTGVLMAKVTGSFTAPVTRKSGSPLALTDIDHFSLQRNGVEIQILAPAQPVLSFTDATPLTGTDTYDVFTITKDSFISDSSNDAVVAIAAADPASAVTDLVATPGA